ncbi:MAG: bifunctional phosphoserine phosphatase/homoserine phosphotransferase ThrH [Gammaproteobacteria bacterium]|nr:MAG: bifunctional phosphoserine phosphatase/homoserine phosphotransferase ThrH [Gammaproteobacteria bacterium]
MDILCLDLEGVLIPEIWLGVADRTGIDELKKTTRDIPVYDDLMRLRLGLIRSHEVDLATIQDVIESLEPLPGATEFLAWVRTRFQVAIVSDTFYEFAMPLMAKLGHPLLLCHRLQIDAGTITGYQLRQDDPKRRSVAAFKSLRYRVFAAGDSFNDIPMLEEADQGFLFQAPENVVAAHPQFPRADDYAALQVFLEEAHAKP